MSRHSTILTRQGRVTKIFGLLGTAAAVIAAGLLVVSQDGYSQDTKASAAKKVDLSKRGAIGVYLYESEDHVLVSKLVPKGPAEKAGLQIGDDIRYVNNERTKTAHLLMDEIASFKPGTKMDVLIRRGTERLTLKIDVVSHADLFPAPAAPPKPTAAAVAPDAMTAEQERKVRALELQLARVQEQIDRLKTQTYVAKPAPPANGFDINGWLEQHRSGENGGDPALFQ